jgi:L-fuconolactonase
MRLVDTHTHVWGEDTAELPWQDEVLPPGWDGSYTHHDLIADMDRAAVDEAVLVSTPLYGHGPRANEYVMRAIEAHPDRFYGVGIMPFYGRDPEGIADRFRQVVGHERMLGVRLHAVAPPPRTPDATRETAEWLHDDRHDPMYDAAVETDSSVFVLAHPEQLPAVETLATKWPDLSIVLDHVAAPEQGDTDTASWEAMEDLARQENVAVKVSSIPRTSAEAWPYEDVHGALHQLLEWFGPERVMRGSDYPWLDDWASYEECLSWFDAVEGLSARDRAYLSYRTFDRLHR